MPGAHEEREDNEGPSFESLERLFWRILGHLAAEGFAVRPHDAHDLLGDFRVEVWGTLRSRYRPSLGSFSAYAAGAFYRFARRKIIRLRLWEGRLAELAQAKQKIELTPAEQIENKEQVERVGRAMQQLPSLERRILTDFLADTRVTERELAKQHALTRYAIRENLINALGRVAIELGQVSTASQRDALVATALWSQGRTIRDVAAELEISAEDVRESRDRNVASLLAALRGRSSSGH